MCGPFQPTLRKLQEALLPSIYSCCSGPSMAGARPLQFDMLPWFALAGRLRRQNNQLLEQQAAFSLQLAQHQVRACWACTVAVESVSPSIEGSSGNLARQQWLPGATSGQCSSWQQEWGSEGEDEV